MSYKKVKCFLKNIEARVTPVSVFILLLLSVFSSIFIFFPSVDLIKASTTTQFSYYTSITINADDIDDTLINFPVMVFVNASTENSTASNLASHCQQNDGGDIAFFDGAGDSANQLYHEIEYFNSTSGELLAWVNITSVSTSGTTFYMFYGNDAIDNQWDSSGNVWDSYYSGVWHFNESSGDAIDRTSNTNDGSFSGSPVYGKVGFFDLPTAVDFQGGDFVDFGSDSTLYQSEGTWEIFFQLNASQSTGSNGDYIMSSDNSGNNNGDHTMAKSHTQPKFFSKLDDGSADTIRSVDDKVLGCYYYFVTSLDVSDNHNLFINDTVENTTSDTHPATFGNSLRGIEIPNSDVNYYADEVVEEVRISNIARNESWLNATSSNFRNPDTFLIFGSTSENSPITITGLDNNRITWEGEAGDTVWSNETYPGGTLNITIYTVNNCTELRINLSHINVTEGILNSNISILCDDDNASWTGDVVAYSGNNFTINATTWSSHSWGGSPFPIDNEEVSIYVRFRLSIPSDADVDTYTVDDWNIWIKIIS